MSQGSAQGKRSFYKLHVSWTVLFELKFKHEAKKTKNKKKPQNHSSL